MLLGSGHEATLGVMADDDDVAEDWEDVDTEELERRMEVRLKQVERKEKKIAKNKSKSSKQSEAQSEEAGSTPVPLEVKTQLPLRIQDSERTEYVAPIKILKRQGDPKSAPSGHHSPSSSSSGSGSGGGSGSRKHKSLAQREADYASARARILGSDYKPGGSGSGEGVGAVAVPPIVNPTSAGASPRGEVGVKRQPRGPNGTRGFKS